MSNPLYFLQNKDQLLQKIQQLKSIGGDPNKQIQQMLNSGRITQEDYNKAVEKANQLRKMFGI